MNFKNHISRILDFNNFIKNFAAENNINLIEIDYCTPTSNEKPLDYLAKKLGTGLGTEFFLSGLHY